MNVYEGRRGDHVNHVAGELPNNGDCADTNQFVYKWSRVYYLRHMEEAQFALYPSARPATPSQPLVQAIGEGIGNDAAHEIGHQFSDGGQFVADMDDDSVDTYQSHQCLGPSAPWIYTGVGTDPQKTPIHWDNNAKASWSKFLH